MHRVLKSQLIRFSVRYMYKEFYGNFKVPNSHYGDMVMTGRGCYLC